MKSLTTFHSIVSTALFVFILASMSFAATSDSRIGAELRALRSPNATDVLLGVRYLHSVSPQFSVGGATYTGQVSEGQSGSFSYGGLVAAYNNNFTDGMGLELSLLAGGGGGFTTAEGLGGGMTIEPNVSVFFNLGATVRSCIGFGYVWLPNNSKFSGVTFGIRFDFLNSVSQKNESSKIHTQHPT